MQPPVLNTAVDGEAMERLSAAASLFCLARSSFSIRRMVRSSIFAKAFSNVDGSIVIFSFSLLTRLSARTVSFGSSCSLLPCRTPSWPCSVVLLLKLGIWDGPYNPFSMGNPILIKLLRALPPGVTTNPASCARKRRLLSMPVKD